MSTSRGRRERQEITPSEVGDMSDVLGEETAVARIGGSGEENDSGSYLPELTEDVGNDGQFRPLQIKIMQPSTPEVAAGEMSGGIFASPLVGELGNELIVIVPLRQGRFRIMNNPDKEFGQNEIVCASSDSLTGYINAESDYSKKDMAGGECAKCVFKEFSKDPKTGRRLAPLCTFNRTFANYLPNHDLTGQLTFRRTSAPAGEDIISIIQQTKTFGHDAFPLDPSVHPQRCVLLLCTCSSSYCCRGRVGRANPKCKAASYFWFRPGDGSRCICRS